MNRSEEQSPPDIEAPRPSETAILRIEQRVAILTYHSLDIERSVLSTPPEVFARQMQTLSDLGARVISLDAVGHGLWNASLPERAVVLTFDDGYRSIYEHGMAVLQEHGFPATVFLVTDYCDGMSSWPSQPSRLQHQPMLEWTQIREMGSLGIAYGCHTCSHPDLTQLALREAETELADSKRRIQDVTGRAVNTLAYPYGAYNDRVRELAEQHFTIACSTSLGFARSDSDPLALERMDMFYMSRPALFRALFSPQFDAYLRLRRQLRGARRWTLSRLGR